VLAKGAWGHAIPIPECACESRRAGKAACQGHLLDRQGRGGAKERGRPRETFGPDHVADSLLMTGENSEEMCPRATDCLRNLFGSEVGVSEMNLYVAASSGVIGLIKAPIAKRDRDRRAYVRGFRSQVPNHSNQHPKNADHSNPLWVRYRQRSCKRMANSTSNRVVEDSR